MFVLGFSPPCYPKIKSTLNGLYIVSPYFLNICVWLNCVETKISAGTDILRRLRGTMKEDTGDSSWVEEYR